MERSNSYQKRLENINERVSVIYSLEQIARTECNTYGVPK